MDDQEQLAERHSRKPNSTFDSVARLGAYLASERRHEKRKNRVDKAGSASEKLHPRQVQSSYFLLFQRKAFYRVPRSLLRVARPEHCAKRNRKSEKRNSTLEDRRAEGTGEFRLQGHHYGSVPPSAGLFGIESGQPYVLS